MKMVLQSQRTKWVDKYKHFAGTASYLTELLFEQTDYATAANDVISTLKGINIKEFYMTVDGGSGKWGCEFGYTAAAPLPLAFGVDDSPEAIFDYYYDYVQSYCNKRNCEKDENGEYAYREITDIRGIAESDSGLVIDVIYDKTDKASLTIPYPS